MTVVQAIVERMRTALDVRAVGRRWLSLAARSGLLALALAVVLPVAVASAGPVAFSPAASFPTAGISPGPVVLGDFNGDGRPDLAIANAGSSSVSVLLGDGAGGFAVPSSRALVAPAWSLAVGDFNADGRADLAAATTNSNSVSVLLGNGAGGFASVATFAVGVFPMSVAAGDLNGDSRLDLVTVNRTSSTVSVLLGNGFGGFSSAGAFAVGTNPFSVVIGDLNGDGKPDLATANFSTSTVSVLLGNGLGGFSPATGFATGLAPLSLAIGDLNGDGKLDLATANQGSGSVSVLLGNGLGGLSVATDFAVGTNPQAVAIGDLDSDGTPDLVATDAGSNRAVVLLGDGTGAFSPAAGFAVPESPWWVAIGDLNGDGKRDLAVTSTGANTVSVLLNIPPDTTPPVLTVPPGVFQQAPSALGSSVSYAASALDAADGPIVPVCSPASGSVFPLGTTTVTCTVADLAGNSASATFAVTVSVIAITSAPPPVSTSQSAPFTWAALFFTRFTCSLDGALFAACSSPRTYNGLAAGPHTLCVRATADVQPTCRTWYIVSPGKPVVTIASVSIVGRSVTLSFSADQPAVRFTCSLDGAAYRTCSPPLTYNGLALGAHTVQVLATNFAGDISAVPAATAFTIS